MPGRKRSRPGRLRIVAGNWRSRLLRIADVEGLRPTPERVRETLFNWLAMHVRGRRCLDLFAGTGALGLEALSRGAAEVVFVENNAEAAATLHDNIATLRATGATVATVDARRYLRSTGERFDIIFVDPPFADAVHSELCRLISESEVLCGGGLVYVEEPRGAPQLELPPGWAVSKSGKAGNVRYVLLTTD